MNNSVLAAIAAGRKVRTYFIYGLTDPRQPDHVRYVGQTPHLVVRWSQHLNGKTGAWVVSQWVKYLEINGTQPDIHVLRVVHGTMKDACQAERLEMRQRRHRLLNGTEYYTDCERDGIGRSLIFAYFRAIDLALALLDDEHFAKAMELVEYFEDNFPTLKLT